MQKQNRVKRIISLILLLAMIITLLSVTTVSAFAAESGVAGFVQRCYQVTLNREPDEAGYADWTGKLTNGEMDGATVAFGFVFSDEYQNAGKDNGAFVTDMYTLFLGRTPDESGYADWVGKLDNGADRLEIFYGFANSTEFFDICTDYGVTAGYFTTEYNKDQVNAVNMFVARMYRICLGRLGDQAGQADWTGKLLRGELTGIDCAGGFINSQEYRNKNLSNEDYVRDMYRTFLGREADEAGFKDWVSQLEDRHTRDEIFAGFANSAEFQGICDRYGIVRGDYTAQDVKQTAWRLKKTYYGDNPNHVENIYEYFPGTSIVKKKTSHSDTGDFDTVYEYDRAGRQIYAKYPDAGGPGHVGYYEGRATEISDTSYKFEGKHYYPWSPTTEPMKFSERYIKLRDGSWHKMNGWSYATYTLETKGNTDVITEYNTFSGEKSVGGKTIYRYDEKNRMIEKSWIYLAGVTKTTWEYDSEDHLIKETQSYNDDNTDVKTYMYDGPQGKVSEIKEMHRTVKYDDGTSKWDTNLTKYEYDSNGNINKVIYNGQVSNEVFEYEQY